MVHEQDILQTCAVSPCCIFHEHDVMMENRQKLDAAETMQLLVSLAFRGESLLCRAAYTAQLDKLGAVASVSDVSIPTELLT